MPDPADSDAPRSLRPEGAAPVPDDAGGAAVLASPVPAAAAPADFAPAEDDPLAAHARQISLMVEAERRRRKRTLLLWSTLLLPPVALAVWVLLWPPPGERPNFNSPEFANTVAPIVQNKVGEQLKPVVEEKLGGQVDAIIEAKVSGKVQGASPARVEELSKEVKQVSEEMSQAQAVMRNLEVLQGELSQVRAGLSDVQAIKAELPQLRERVSANDGRVQALLQKIDSVPNNRGGDAVTAVAIKRLEDRLAELDAKFDRSVQSLAVRLGDNTKSLRALSERVSKMDRGTREQFDRKQ